jgi:hypothetical protein
LKQKTRAFEFVASMVPANIVALPSQLPPRIK